jgi:LmbE family N-acetylglucosaminyl deacetylase
MLNKLARAIARRVRPRGSAHFAPRNFQIGAAFEAGAALILSPHPDDEALGLGGSLRLMQAAGTPITVLYMTSGGGAANDPALIATRRKEAEAVGGKFGFDQVFWDMADTRLSEDPRAAGQLRALLGSLTPASIFVPSFFEHHRDHLGANRALAAALRGMPGFSAAIYGYEVWDNLPAPNFIVDVSAHWDAKAEMIAQYATPNQYTDFTALCRHRNALHYLLYVDSRRAPPGYAEAFLRLETREYLRRMA